MKILSIIVVSSATFALVGCRNQGGSRDDYSTGSGVASSTNYHRSSISTNYQGDAFSPGRVNTGTGYRTNYPGLDTNDQDANSPQTFDTEGKPIEPTNTNNVPDN